MKKVSRQMLHEDLRPFSVYWPAQILKYFYRSKWPMKLSSAVIGRMIRHDVPATIRVEERYFPSGDGEATIRVRICRPASSSGDLPGMLYIHGGGYVAGNPDVFDGLMAKFIERRPCVIVAPAYRNALTKPFPAALDDCYDTLLWARDHAAELGIESGPFMVAGHSAGGGLAAAVTLKARDTQDVRIAFQMPFYPMIDDRQPTDPARYIDAPGWDTRANAFGWASYLKDLRQRNAEVPAYAAPARNTDYRDFPPTITFVGEYEPFYWETVEYVDQLRTAGVEVAFKIYEGCTHGHEQVVPDSPIGRDGLAFTFDNYADFYDRFVVQGDASRR